MQGVQMMRGSTDVGANDVVNGSREATLGLLWRAFLQFQVCPNLPAAATRHLQAVLLLVD